MLVVVILVVLVMAFVGALVWITTRDATQPTRGLLMLSALTLALIARARGASRLRPNQAAGRQDLNTLGQGLPPAQP